jgi:hypothetical protein
VEERNRGIHTLVKPGGTNVGCCMSALLIYERGSGAASTESVPAQFGVKCL